MAKTDLTNQRQVYIEDYLIFKKQLKFLVKL